MRSHSSLLLAATVAVWSSAACGGSGSQLAAERRDTRKALQKQLPAFENPSLDIGFFKLAKKSVVDGDTVHVEGLGSSLRLLGVDAEETFKYEKDRRAFKVGWDLYQKNMRGASPRPVKYATPLGEEAKKYAIAFFENVDTVRLERDHPKEIRDYYNRYLAYVFAVRGGKDYNYNVEVVRAGMSPYFSKYGYSRRFHDDFVAAENEARAAKRGIWDPSQQHYPDYDERKVWWDARAEFIKAYEEEARAHDNYIVLTNHDTPERLDAMVGKEVVVLGAVSEVRLGDGRAPTRVMLSRRRTSDFPLIFMDREVFMSSGVGNRVGEYVRVKGFVTRYESKRDQQSQLQIKIDLPSQITGAAESNAQAR